MGRAGKIVMPRLSRSAVQLNGERYRPVEPTALAPTQVPTPLPNHLTQSSLLISSLPSIVSGVDGITRQFYGYARLPIQRGTL